MIRRSLARLVLSALFLAVAVGGPVLAGEDCYKNSAAARTAHAGEKGSHCHLGLTKNIVKTARKTDDGAVVTLSGKTTKAVEYLKAHLTKHDEGQTCAGCPMTMDGVTTTVMLNDKGGQVTLVGSSDETIEKIQVWAEKPAACCEASRDV
jgi:hypothetical protein